jgi:hypothetical protein
MDSFYQLFRLARIRHVSCPAKFKDMHAGVRALYDAAKCYIGVTFPPTVVINTASWNTGAMHRIIQRV